MPIPPAKDKMCTVHQDTDNLPQSIFFSSQTAVDSDALNMLELSLSSELPPNIRKPLLRGCFPSCKHKETRAKRLSLGLFLAIEASTSKSTFYDDYTEKLF